MSLLSLAELLAMSVWFSASTVVPTLSGLWSLSNSGRAWLTMATIRLGPTLVSRVGWGWAFTLLAAGPAAGLAATVLLRRIPAAERLAGSQDRE